MATTRTYSPSVRVGNWNEDNQLEEDTLKDFLERKERGELLIQKSHNLSQAVLHEATLSISRDGYVHYGDQVMLLNMGAADKTKFSAGVDPRDDSVLAINIDERSAGPCGVSGSKDKRAIGRNTFIITSPRPHENPKGEPLRYGQSFYLETLPSQGSLLLSSDRASFQKCAKKSRHQEVSLAGEGSILTEWNVKHFNPQVRFEYEDAPVPANSKVVVSHTKTNQALCIEENHMFRTPFGSDYEVSANTYLDSHKAEKDINHWTMVMGVPGENNPLPVCMDKEQNPQQ